MPLIQSVERALQIIELFDEQTPELKITAISEKMGLHKSTVHSLLKTLQEYHYIDQNPDNGKYRLGMKLAERGNFVISTMDIRQEAKKYLIDLSHQTRQTTHLGILDHKEGVYIDKVEGERAIIRYSRIGRRLPLHSTAVGKVLLSFQLPEEIKHILDGYQYTQQTANTITNQADLLVELEKIRNQDFAVDEQENEEGVRCVAVPIRNNKNQVLAAISMSTLVSRVDHQELEEFISLLKKAGEELSEKMGYGFSEAIK